MSDLAAWKIQDGFVIPVTAAEPAVSGIQLILQRFMKILLTETGSVRYKFGRQTERSCPFMSAWRQGLINSEADLLAQFNLAGSYIRAAMRSMQSHHDPDELKYKDVRCTGLTVQPHTVQMHITLETEAEALELTLPLPT
jgi:hypothetical protein